MVTPVSESNLQETSFPSANFSSTLNPDNSIARLNEGIFESIFDYGKELIGNFNSVKEPVTTESTTVNTILRTQTSEFTQSSLFVHNTTENQETFSTMVINGSNIFEATTISESISTGTESYLPVVSAFEDSKDSVVSDLVAQLTHSEKLESYVNIFFLFSMSIIIFLLSLGFALREAGSIRSKNSVATFLVRVQDLLVGGLVFWLCGYMIAYSQGNAFMGLDPGYLITWDLPGTMSAHWFVSFTVLAVVLAIVSGPMAERTKLSARWLTCVTLAFLTYPVVVHWAWTAQGWLHVNGYRDFAGSGVVHHLAGVQGLMGAVFLGPRIGRFGINREPKNIPGHSATLQALGAFIIFFGMFALNAAPEGMMEMGGDMLVLQLTAINSLVAGAGAGLVTLTVQRLRKSSKGKWSLVMLINGTLAGMVAIAASCDSANPHSAFLVGLLAGLAYILLHQTLLWFHIDDPLDAVAVHSGGGMLGLLAAPFAVTQGGVFDPDAKVAAMAQIWSQLVGILVISAWAATCTGILFFLLRLNKLLRLEGDQEMRGLDTCAITEAAYPEQRAVNNKSTEVSKGPMETKPTTGNTVINLEPEINKKAFLYNLNEMTPEMLDEAWKGTKNVKPLGFRKFSDSFEDSVNDQKGLMTGMVNPAFEEDEDVLDFGSNNDGIKETHFGGSWEKVDNNVKGSWEDVNQELKKSLANIVTDKNIEAEKPEERVVEYEENSETVEFDEEEEEKGEKEMQGEAVAERDETEIQENIAQFEDIEKSTTPSPMAPVSLEFGLDSRESSVI